VADVRIDGWNKYRIRYPARAGDHRGDPVFLTACDGERYWEVHEDRVSTGEARRAPAEVADLADASWLLGCELSGGEPVTVDGRQAYRLCVRGSFWRSQLLLFSYPAIAVVDAEAGRLLRLTTYGDGKPAFRYELRDVTGLDPEPDDASFAFEVPPGLRVVPVDSPADHPSPARIAKGLLGALGDRLRR
jgi:hypothetical protein